MTSLPSARSTFSVGTKVPLIKRARIERDRGSFMGAEARWNRLAVRGRSRRASFAVSAAFSVGSMRDFRSSNFGTPAESSATLASSVGVAIEFAAHVLDDEILQLAGEFCGAFVQWLQVRAFHFVAALHLADQQFGIAANAKCGDVVRAWRNRAPPAARNIRRRCWFRGRYFWRVPARSLPAGSRSTTAYDAGPGLPRDAPSIFATCTPAGGADGCESANRRALPGGGFCSRGSS